MTAAPRYRIDPNARLLLVSELNAGEELVWAAQPDRAAVRRAGLRELVVVVLVLLGGSIFAVLAIKGFTPAEMLWFVLAAVGIGLAVIGIVHAFSPSPKDCAYGLTRQRAILFLPRMLGRSTHAVSFADMDDPLTVKDQGDGKASIVLWQGRNESDVEVRMDGIDDAEAVVQLIRQLRGAGGKPGAASP